MYKCNSCGKEFFFEGQLKRHTLFNHSQAEQPSSLFTEIERQVSSVLEEVPLTNRRNRYTVHHNPETSVRYQHYSTLDLWRQPEEDLSIEWNRTLSPPPELGDDSSYNCTASSLQVRAHQWLVNEIYG